MNPFITASIEPQYILGPLLILFIIGLIIIKRKETKKAIHEAKRADKKSYQHAIIKPEYIFEPKTPYFYKEDTIILRELAQRHRDAITIRNIMHMFKTGMINGQPVESLIDTHYIKAKEIKNIRRITYAMEAKNEKQAWIYHHVLHIHTTKGVFEYEIRPMKASSNETKQTIAFLNNCLYHNPDINIDNYIAKAIIHQKMPLHLNTHKAAICKYKNGQTINHSDALFQINHKGEIQ